MKKKFYLTLDTETATLPFADSICKNSKAKQTIAIAKPLVYDLGWVITDRQGNIIKEENFLIQETFFVPNVFNTAYYKNKRPIYLDLLHKGEIQVATWNQAVEILLEDLRKCDLVTAYNACFDFKKAIPFTEKYIYHLYSADFNIWENDQKRKCLDLLENGESNKNEDFLKPFFELRGERFPVADLWGVACDRLINIDRYRNYCLDNSLLTVSAMYFKTSAETSFQYLMKNHDFSEDHTALSDAIIESQILAKALKKGKVEPQIKAFPFRELGTTITYVKQKPKYIEVVRQTLKLYLESNNGYEKANDGQAYWKRTVATLKNLDNY